MVGVMYRKKSSIVAFPSKSADSLFGGGSAAAQTRPLGPYLMVRRHNHLELLLLLPHFRA